MNTHLVSELALERMVTAVQKVRDRLLRSTRALDEAGIPYAVAGGNAVASLVSEVDEAAVRNTQDVDIMLRREDLLKAKAALESCSRYLARDLGPENVRVNLVAAGPIKTMAAKSIPGFEEFETVWNDRAPLKWDVSDPTPAAQATVALLSDWFPKTTAEIIHVDGGVHGMGA